MSRQYQYHWLTSKKHKSIALILCIMFGILGLHYFYVRRYWRGALNLLLLLALCIASSVFGMIYIQISFGQPQGILIQWREAVSLLCAAILGVTWILDLVHICQGRFKDAAKLPLK